MAGLVKRKLPGKEFVIFEFVLILIAFVAVTAVYRAFSASMVEIEEEHMTEASSYVATMYDGFIYTAKQNLTSLSTNKNINNVIANRSPDSRQNAIIALSESKSSLTGIEAIGLFSPDGKLIAENHLTKGSLDNNISKQPFFASAVSTKSPSVSSSLLSPVSGNKTQAIEIPILDSSKNVIGVIIGVIDAEVLKNFLTSAQSQEETHVIGIYSSSGDFVFDTTTDKSAQFKTGLQDQIKNIEAAGTNTAKFYQDKKDMIVVRKKESFIISLTQSKSIVTGSVKSNILKPLIIIALVVHITLIVIEIVRSTHRSSRMDQLILYVNSLNRGGIVAQIDENELGKTDRIAELARELTNLPKK